MIIIYTKDNCGYCTRAKQLLTMKNEAFEEKKIGIDIPREQFLQMYPHVRTVPHILVDGVEIGGYNQLIERYEPKFLQE